MEDEGGSFNQGRWGEITHMYKGTINAYNPYELNQMFTPKPVSFCTNSLNSTNVCSGSSVQ